METLKQVCVGSSYLTADTYLSWKDTCVRSCPEFYFVGCTFYDLSICLDTNVKKRSHAVKDRNKLMNRLQEIIILAKVCFLWNIYCGDFIVLPCAGMLVQCLRYAYKNLSSEKVRLTCFVVPPFVLLLTRIFVQPKFVNKKKGISKWVIYSQQHETATTIQTIIAFE